MREICQKVSKFGRFIRGFTPMALPRDWPSFETFWVFIHSTYDFPALASYRNAVAAMIQHLGPQTSRKPPYFFAVSIRKAMANQTAFEVMQRIKEDAKNAHDELMKSQPEVHTASNEIT